MKSFFFLTVPISEGKTDFRLCIMLKDEHLKKQLDSV